MNRRDFIKTSIPAVAIPAIAITCKYEDDEKGAQTGTTVPPDCDWPYRVYCYERGQGEWTFSHNVRGSFAPEREYMTFEEENDLSWNPHYAAGWMNGGVLHFQTFADATDFVDMHVRTKDDINITDSIYDIYRKIEWNRGDEIHMAHYWFNGDTGSQIHWEVDGFNRETGEGLTDWNKVESG